MHVEKKTVWKSTLQFFDIQKRLYKYLNNNISHLGVATSSDLQQQQEQLERCSDKKKKQELLTPIACFQVEVQC